MALELSLCTCSKENLTHFVDDCCRQEILVCVSQIKLVLQVVIAGFASVTTARVNRRIPWEFITGAELKVKTHIIIQLCIYLLFYLQY